MKRFILVPLILAGCAGQEYTPEACLALSTRIAYLEAKADPEDAWRLAFDQTLYQQNCVAVE